MLTNTVRHDQIKLFYMDPLVIRCTDLTKQAGNVKLALRRSPLWICLLANRELCIVS